MKTIKRYYTTLDGSKRWPLYEAPWDFYIKVYRKDCRRAVQSDPEQCLIALGALHNRAILAAFIGAGKDAYIAFKATKLRPEHVLHFTLGTDARRVRDYFDTHKGVDEKIVKLSMPTAGRTLAHRSVLNRRRRLAIRAGTHVVKFRNTPKQRRIIVITDKEGVEHYRPKAVIERDVVTVPELSERSA